MELLPTILAMELHPPGMCRCQHLLKLSNYLCSDVCMYKTCFVCCMRVYSICSLTIYVMKCFKILFFLDQ